MNKAQLIKAAQARIVKYGGKELGGQVYIKGLTPNELTALIDSSQLKENESIKFNVFLLLHTICDSKGKLIFELSDAGEFESFGVGLIIKLATISKELNGMDDTTDDAEKN